MDAQRAEFYLNVTRAEAEKGYDLIGFSQPSGLIENIMRLGLQSAQTRVLTGQGGCKAANAAPHSEKGDGE